MVKNLQHHSNQATAATTKIIHQTGLPGTEGVFEPTQMLEVEISNPIPHVVASDSKTGVRYQRALALICLHTYPLGIVELRFDANGLTADEHALRIWESLEDEIVEHLREDGLPHPNSLSAAGVVHHETAKCLVERQEMLVNAPFVTVIVATRNRAASLATSLDALLALEYPHYEVAVVDNAPSDESTAELIRTSYANVPKMRYTREEHPGLACAHNRGLQVTDAPIVAFTDDDVVVDRHWLTELVAGFELAPNVGCVTGMILPAELETPAQVWIEQYSGFSKGFSRKLFDLNQHRPANPLFPYAAGTMGSGASMAFKTDALKMCGGFDPALGAGSKGVGGDDLAAFFEIITHGYALVYTPASLLYHRHRRDYAGLRNQAYGYGVGLFAFLTRTIVERPSRVLDFILKLPYGLYYILNAKSPKNYNKQAAYPEELTRIERKGMLYGPLAYLRSRWHVARMAL